MATVLLAITAAFALPNHPAHANPTGGQVVAGQASINQTNPNATTITQTSDRAIINWQSYNIGANQRVQYIQPAATSVSLNRVIGQDPSQILGSLTANGRVFLVNPNGIFFGKGAQIDVAGLVASTHNIRDADFMAGHYLFNLPGKPGAAVINEGTIHIADTGIAAFVAPSVANQGVIAARLGKVVLAAANGFTLDFYGDGLLTFMVNDQVAQTAFDLQGKPLTSFVENAGSIQAHGGYVLLTAKAAENVVQSVINQTGSIEAVTVGQQSGTIILNAGTGTLNVSGTLDASASLPPLQGAGSSASLPPLQGAGSSASLPPLQGEGRGGDGVNGGFIETSGAHVNIDPNAKITTAAPQGTTGKWLIDPVNFTIAATGGDMTGAQLTTALGLNNVIIQSVNGATGTTGDINVNDAVSWSANKLTLNAQNNIYLNTALYGTGTASLALEYGQAALAAGNTSSYFVKAPVNLPAGQNFSTKLGSNGVATNYTVITSLGAANSVSATDLQGIRGNWFGNYVLGGNIDAAPTATWNAGAGFDPLGCWSCGTGFYGTFDGLGHTISNLTVNLPLRNYVALFGYTAGSTIQNVGLVGGSMNGQLAVGMLVGENNGTVRNSFATGNVSAAAQAGGLLGTNKSGTVSNSYATGNVTTANGAAGGLIAGLWASSGTISNSYSTGRVNFVTNFDIGGIVGGNPGIAIVSSYWDTLTSGQATSLSGTGLTTAQMQQQASYVGWDFVNTWRITPGAYPTLAWQTPTPANPNNILTPVVPPVVPPVVNPPVVTPPVVGKKPVTTPAVDYCKYHPADCNPTVNQPVTTTPLPNDPNKILPDTGKNISSADAMRLGGLKFQELSGGVNLMSEAMQLQQALDSVESRSQNLVSAIPKDVKIGDTDLRTYFESKIKLQLTANAFDAGATHLDQLNQVYDQVNQQAKIRLTLASKASFNNSESALQEFEDVTQVTLGNFGTKLLTGQQDAILLSASHAWEMTKVIPSIAKLEARVLLSSATNGYDYAKAIVSKVGLTMDAERAVELVPLMPGAASDVWMLGYNIYQYFKNSDDMSARADAVPEILRLSDSLTQFALKASRAGGDPNILTGFGMTGELTSITFNSLAIADTLKAQGAILALPSDLVSTATKNAIMKQLTSDLVAKTASIAVSAGKIIGVFNDAIGIHVDVISDMMNIVNAVTATGTLSFQQKLVNSQSILDQQNAALGNAAALRSQGMRQYAEELGNLVNEGVVK